ncbi:GAF domain-containing protein [Mucilaginibacter pallidiroseus]|uniref:GAF domain-containing protein n=1 Tax=Mucilaginibacter pallidiroseus TaxID=2599295 RepID=UPI001647F0DC|nr:GAF domain-containing protein [Mucilaginibacter pallidiroseus]
MNLKQFTNNPFQLRISFHLLIEHLETTAAGTGAVAAEAANLLKEIDQYPELRDGIEDTAKLEELADVIQRLLAPLFPEALTYNEIKAITIPFQDILFNPTKRLQNIIKASGSVFDIVIRDFDEHELYIYTCCLILNEFYDGHFNFSRPLFYDIPDANGVMKHYRILYNADYMELIPTADAPKITPADIELLRDNFDDLDLWKKYFPKDSWIMKGFAIINMYDATVENAVSSLKGALLNVSYGDDVRDNVVNVFRSIYRISDLHVGFTAVNNSESTFMVAGFKPNMKSYLLAGNVEEESFDHLCQGALKSLMENRQFFAVSDVDKYLAQDRSNVMAWRFAEQGVQSFILAPIVKNNGMLGVIELVSRRKGELNSINANQLNVVLPYIVDAIDKKITDIQNQVQAVIQNEYTTIHPSVYWKFEKEAFNFLKNRLNRRSANIKEIVFDDVYPLYGQVDIKGSSDARNASLQLDLQGQLTALIPLVEQVQAQRGNSNISNHVHALQELVMDVQGTLRADTEQNVLHYLDTYIHPLLKDATDLPGNLRLAISGYFKHAAKNGDYHHNRRKYEETVSLINSRMANLLDVAQFEVQTVFPHYYERFKTDGVEHNLYIGASITPSRKYDVNYLYNLRLWQLQVICQMEMEHRFVRESLPYPLDVTSLILSFSTPISIRFRMDEKRFDVDGSYNARFEIVKKRIDKAFIKNTSERLTTTGKITIVYANHEEEVEYLNYIRFLQAKHLFGDEVEMLEVEDLQGVSGLKAIRVKLLYNNSLPPKKFYSYDELLLEQANHLA